MGDEKTIKLIIHYGGTMKLENEDYNYQHELDCKSVFLKLSEIKWEKFVDFMSSEHVDAPIRLLWCKEAIAEMKMLKYVFDICNSDMSELLGCAKSSCEVDVFIEHDWSEHMISENEIDGGYEPDEDERMEESDNESNDGDMPPKEDDEPEDSEDERPAVKSDELNEKQSKTGEKQDLKEADGGIENQSGTVDNQIHGEGLNVNQNEVDDGDEVIVDAGNGGDDTMFLSVFEEDTRRNEELDAVTRKLVEEKAAKEKEEEEEEETDPEFGLEDVKYPDTPLESDEEWEQWKNPKRVKGKDKFHGDLNKEPYIWLFQTFNSGLEFNDQLLRYSLNTQYDVKMAKSEANRIAAICCKEECPWKVLCSCSVEHRLNKWMVKVCHYKHNHGKSSRVSMLKQGVIGGLFREEIERGISPLKLLFSAMKTTIESGRLGSGPSKLFEPKNNICTDEFTKTSAKPWKPLNKLLKKLTELRRGRLHNHSGIFPLIILLDMSIYSNFLRVFKMFGNTLMLQCLKFNISTVNGMYESELKLAGDILLLEISRIDKDLSDEKRLKSSG